MEENKKLSNAEKVKNITDKLQKGVKDFMSNEKYADYLKVMSKFHKYSVNNTILIAMQKPDATRVAGFQSWKNNFGRTVKKGEKGIQILAPASFTEKKKVEKINPITQKPIIGINGKPVLEEIEVKVPYFKPTYVFDVSQTSGKELPQLGVDELTGNVDGYRKFFDALKAVSPMPIDFIDIESGAKGYCNYGAKRIAIQEGMSQVQNVKTAIHEISHAKLHDIDHNAKDVDASKLKGKQTKEVEAESVAYTVCQHYGIETSDYTFGYITSWSSGKELPELMKSMKTIRETASELIYDIDNQLKELQNERETVKEMENPLRQIEDVVEQNDNNFDGIINNIPPMPDNTTIEEMNDYGYSWEGMIPMDKGKALELFNKDLTVYLLYPDGTESMAIDNIDIQTFSGMFGIERDEWERYIQNESIETSKVSAENLMKFEQDFLNSDKDGYALFQLKAGEDLHGIRFEGLNQIGGEQAVIKEHYQCVYSVEIDLNEIDDKYEILNQIYDKFNIELPDDFKGHSLSVSDVIAMRKDGEMEAYYVDSVGFTELPQFLGEMQNDLVWDNDKQMTMEKYSEAPMQSQDADNKSTQEQKSKGRDKKQGLNNRDRSSIRDKLTDNKLKVSSRVKSEQRKPEELHMGGI